MVSVTTTGIITYKTYSYIPEPDDSFVGVVLLVIEVSGKDAVMEVCVDSQVELLSIEEGNLEVVIQVVNGVLESAEIDVDALVKLLLLEG